MSEPTDLEPTDLEPAAPARPGLPPGVQPRYRGADWAPLVNACRQRSRYRFGLFLPGETVEPFPAGEGARWFHLPPGLLLLAPSNAGRWSSCCDLAKQPAHLGPFVLRWLPPVSSKTAAKRAHLRERQAARREERGTRAAGVPAVPNEGRPFEGGGRLSLAVSGAFVKQRRREVESMAKRQAVARSKPGKRGEVELWRPALEFIETLNSFTTELEEVAEFCWVEVAILQAWDATTRTAALRSLLARGMKPGPARQLVGARVRVWQRSRPSSAARQAADAVKPARLAAKQAKRQAKQAKKQRQRSERQAKQAAAGPTSGAAPQPAQLSSILRARNGGR